MPVTAELQYKQTSEGFATPQKESKATLYVLVKGLDDTTAGLSAARAAAISAYTVPNLAGQLLYPFGTWLVAPELVRSPTRWLRGAADADGAMALVALEFAFLDSVTVFGSAGYTNTRQVSQPYYAKKPWEAYTTYTGGQSTTEINTRFTSNGQLQFSQQWKSLTEQEIIIKARTSVSQAAWSNGFQGSILNAPITLLGATYPAGTVLFEGVEQNFIESQENVVGFKFTVREVWGWLQDIADNPSGTQKATSQPRFAFATWVAPTL